MKEIVVINGSGGVGKDTFVQFCNEYTPIMNISSVDKVKEAAKVLAGWNGEKDEKSRKFLSDLKELNTMMLHLNIFLIWQKNLKIQINK